MKLNFKEWNMVYEALTEKAASLANDLKWRIDWAKEHDSDTAEDTPEVRELRAKLESLTSIIRRLETSTI